MSLINCKSMRLFWVAAGVLAIGSGLLAQNRPDGQEQVRPKSPRAEKQKTVLEKRVHTDLHGDPLPDGAVTRLGTLRFRAPAEIVGLAYAPDGKTIAVSSYAGLFLFDAASGKRIRRLDPDSAQVINNTAVFSPDSKRLALRAQAIVGPKGKQRIKGLVRVWDLTGERKPKDYDFENVTWFGWSANNEPLAICLEKGGLRLHELAAGKSRFFACQEIRRPELGAYLQCDYALAGQTLAVRDEQGMVHVWDGTTGRKRCTIKVTLVSLALTPDGRNLATLNYDQASGERKPVQIWDTATGKVLHTLAADRYLSTVLFAPDGKTLVTAGWRGVRFWDVSTGKERSRCQDPVPETEKVAFSSDGKTLAMVERHSPAFHLWDVATGKRKPEPPGHTGRPRGVFSADGRHIFTSGGMDGTVHLWNTTAGNSLLQIPSNRWVRGLAVSADGRKLFSAYLFDDQLWVSDSASGEKLQGIKLHDPDRPDTYQEPWSLILSADGKTLVAFSYYTPQKGRGPRYQEMLITGWDATTYKQLFRRRRPGQEFWTAVSADARLLASNIPDPGSKLPVDVGVIGSGAMRLEDLATGAVLLTFPALEGQTYPLAFSPDGRLLASNNSNYRHQKEGDPTSTPSSLRLWETATAIEVLSLPFNHGQNRAAFSPDGRLLAMTAPKQEILVYDLAAGREANRFKDFGAEVAWLAFSPDGRRLASGLEDSTLLIWDVGSRPGQQNGELGAKDAAQAWTDLAGSNGPRAFRARWALAAAPDTAVSFLQKRLQPIQPAESKHLQRLIANLDDKRFPVRQEAQKELEQIGELAAPALKKALTEKSSLEVRQRIDGLLAKLRGPVTRPEMMRAVRAVAVLEDVATPQARKLLEALSEGAPEARLTQEAKTALTRLGKPPR
jgi:WD40 repeat protein